jgi:hypothetical protein
MLSGLARLKKECKSDSLKFQGSPKTIKFDEVLEQSEFETLFGGKGVLVQPTPQNKPKSTVTIIEFVSAVSLFLHPVSVATTHSGAGRTRPRTSKGSSGTS